MNPGQRVSGLDLPALRWVLFCVSCFLRVLFTVVDDERRVYFLLSIFSCRAAWLAGWLEGGAFNIQTILSLVLGFGQSLFKLRFKHTGYVLALSFIWLLTGLSFVSFQPYRRCRKLVLPIIAF